MEDVSSADLKMIDDIMTLDDESLQQFCYEPTSEVSSVIASLVFPSEPRSFNLLDAKTAAKLLKAANTVDPPQEIVVCANCRKEFMPEEFEMHLCSYDENHQLITSNSFTKEESMLHKIHNDVLKLMRENQVESRNLRNEMKNPDGFECVKCCRKFVHYSGMYRHWDSHVGELLPESMEQDDSAKLATVTLCVFCGEIFEKFDDAYKHMNENHVDVFDRLRFKNLSSSQNSMEIHQEFNSASQKSGAFSTSTPKKDESQEQKQEIVKSKSWIPEPNSSSCETKYYTALSTCSTAKPENPNLFEQDAFWDIIEAFHPGLKTTEKKSKAESIQSSEVGSTNLDISGIDKLPLESPATAASEDDCQGPISKDANAHQLRSENAEGLKDCEPQPTTVQKNDSKDFLRTIRIAKLYQCEFCDSIFANAKSMLLHASTHPPSSAFNCFTCEIKYMPYKELLLHRLNDCIIIRNKKSCLVDFPRVWVCNVCDEEFRGLEQLITHRHGVQHLFPRKDPETNKLAFLCEFCLARFPIAQQYFQHIDEKHKQTIKENEIAETSERIQKSPSKRRGGIHQTSTRPRQYLCEVCGKSYTQSSHLWQHLRFHQGVKPFVCDVEGCGRSFTIRPDLSDHKRKCHTGERPYLCTICNKRFLTGSVFYQHRLIHRNERRYKCEECDKRFYRADALRNHTRIHTGEKPYKCNECDKQFRQRGDRDKHMKTRHPNAEVIVSPKKPRIKSFGRGRVKNNTSLYQKMPQAD